MLEEQEELLYVINLKGSSKSADPRRQLFLSKLD